MVAHEPRLIIPDYDPDNTEPYSGDIKPAGVDNYYREVYDSMRVDN